MKKMLSGAITGLTALACVATAVPASAQGRGRDSDRDGRSDRSEWNRDRDRDGRPDQYDRYDNRRQHARHDNRRTHWKTYGGRYGYSGYNGRWRAGQRYPYWNNSRYYVNDYGAYNLPPPRQGYRYYRDNNSGDIILAAIGSGVIGYILGSQLGR